MGTYRALIVACESYLNDFAPIPNAVAEAQLFGNALVAFGYEPFEVQYYLDANQSNVTEAVGKFFTTAAPDDFILFYFGGHGRKEDDGDLYLVLRDTRLRELITTGLSAATLNKLINKCPAQKKVVVLDACYSAAIEYGARSDYQQIEIERYIQQGKGTAILTSSNAVQLSYSREDRHSFTYFLIEGLKNGNADANGDGSISIDEWFEYAHAGVLRSQIGQPTQNPQMFYKSKEGSMYIGRAIQEEPPDTPVKGIERSGPPPLKCELRLEKQGEVPYLSITLANPNPFALTSIEITGYTFGAELVLHQIESLSPGEKKEVSSPLYSNTGPLLQLLINAQDADNRPFRPVVISIAPEDNSRKPAGHQQDRHDRPAGSKNALADDLSEDEDESVLDNEKKPKKSFR